MGVRGGGHESETGEEEGYSGTHGGQKRSMDGRRTGGAGCKKVWYGNVERAQCGAVRCGIAAQHRKLMARQRFQAFLMTGDGLDTSSAYFTV